MIKFFKLCNIFFCLLWLVGIAYGNLIDIKSYSFEIDQGVDSLIYDYTNETKLIYYKESKSGIGSGEPSMHEIYIEEYGFIELPGKASCSISNFTVNCTAEPMEGPAEAYAYASASWIFTCNSSSLKLNTEENVELQTGHGYSDAYLSLMLRDITIPEIKEEMEHSWIMENIIYSLDTSYIIDNINPEHEYELSLCSRSFAYESGWVLANEMSVSFENAAVPECPTPFLLIVGMSFLLIGTYCFSGK